MERKQHFVLVHNAFHGAWIWYKLKPLLESVGHRVTPINLAASGIDPRPIQAVESFDEFSQPLIKTLESLPDNEKVIFVGFCLGGIFISIAADKFPEKIEVLVFINAFLPDTTHVPSYILEKDYELAMMLHRQGSFFQEDLSKKAKFTEAGYGSVARVFVMSSEDKAIIPCDFIRWMIDNLKVAKVYEIDGGDHILMLSKPQELFHSLSAIAADDY